MRDLTCKDCGKLECRSDAPMSECRSDSSHMDERCHGNCRDWPKEETPSSNTEPENVVGEREEVKEIVKSLKTQFWEDADHEVGGYVSRKEILDKLVPYVARREAEARVEGMKKVMQVQLKEWLLIHDTVDGYNGRFVQNALEKAARAELTRLENEK